MKNLLILSIPYLISAQLTLVQFIYGNNSVNVFSNDYIIGPEITIQGASGYYDYQSNGDCRKYIQRHSPGILMAVYMTANDSLNIPASRKTVYSLSTNDGSNWNFISDIPPNTRSGFPSVTSLLNGESIIINNTISGTSVAKETFPLSGVFNYYISPLNFSSVSCSRLSNGKILLSGINLNDSALTEIFDPNTNTFTNFSFFSISANIRTTHAVGSNGKALIIITTSDYPVSRIYISYTENNGLTWSPAQLLIQSGLINGEYINLFFGLDAVYDQSGNYYVAFNSTDSLGNYASAKLWVKKNNEPPMLVAQHFGNNAIPEAAEVVLNSQAGISTIDHPSLSVSDDDSMLFVSYSVLFQDDTLNGFNKSHIYLSTCRISSSAFNPPVKITNSGPGSFDERYSSINKITPTLGGGLNRTIYMVYQNDSQPGSCVFNDNAPVSRSGLVFRKIYDVSNPIGINNNSEIIPGRFSLFQNFPNPFNPETKIGCYIPKSSDILLTIYDINGKLVKVLYNGFITNGIHYFDLGMEGFSSGIYYYRLQSGYYFETKKMILIK